MRRCLAVTAAVAVMLSGAGCATTANQPSPTGRPDRLTESPDPSWND